MQAIVIDLNQADAYLSLPDGTNVNIAITRLPTNVKVGEKIHLNPSNSIMENYRITGLL